MIIFDEGIISQWQGHDYALVNDDGNYLLIMLPHGGSNGDMTDRTGKVIISEEEILKIAEDIRAAMAIKYEFNADDCKIVAAPCYPNQVRSRVKNLIILGDWDNCTHSNRDDLDRIFISEHDCPQV